MEEDDEIPEYIEFTTSFFRHDRFSQELLHIGHLHIYLFFFNDYAFEEQDDDSIVFHFRQKSKDPRIDDFILTTKISKNIIVKVKQSFLFNKCTSETGTFFSVIGSQN